MNKDVEAKYSRYPEHVKKLLLELRELIFDTAKAQGIMDLEECLKWGEPSFISKGGSTIRIDWKERKPEQYCIYFNCQTKLVETFRELYGADLKFEGNRAIVLDIGTVLPKEAIQHCVSIALRYKSLKHLDMLGQ